MGGDGDEDGVGGDDGSDEDVAGVEVVILIWMEVVLVKWRSWGLVVVVVLIRMEVVAVRRCL